MGEDSFVGSISQFAGSYAPRNWVVCNGQKLEIKHHEALYSLISSVYGGDNNTYFCVPNMPVPEGMPKYYICVDGEYPSRW